jgi:hypothetical protein
MQRAYRHPSVIKAEKSIGRVPNGQKLRQNASSESRIVNPHWRWGQMYEVENHMLIEEIFIVSKDSHFYNLGELDK